ncbi:hypothetical protein ANN_24491 [Periplaneta americana]|uniref:Lipase domain-containing protein n=1 Tax=Periplaneta americana TaxID=6978 RepID=A0ABQ8S365_PERAM|nr:hypothetical protein ANN_24491 [Periplaneta americana]
MLMENVPLTMRRDMWFQPDGAPPHLTLAVRAERWIERGIPINIHETRILIKVREKGASVRSPPSHLKLDNVHVPWMLMPDDEGNLHVAYLVETSPRESTNITEEVILLLYTRSNAATGPYRLYANDVNNLKASGYDPSHPTEILIHGFTSNGQSSVIIGSKDAYLSKGEYNVIGVDWGVLCPSPLYVEACQNAVLVGELLAELIEFLVAEGGAQLQDFHVTGHSLGAQVAGFTGSNTKSGKVGRITGLDAAYPMFGNADASGRLDATDGVLVDAIHTCGGSLGFEEPIALVDFYPNGGLRPQPGCDNDVTGTEGNTKRLLSKDLKVSIHKTAILLVVLYVCETWTLTLKEEQRLRVFENKVLRKIFGAKRDEVTGEWRKLHNAELHALYSSPGIIRNIKSRRLRWTGHVARMGESRNTYILLVERPEGERPLRRPRRRWEDNIKMNLREMEYDDRDWINLAQDRDQWRAYVRAAMNLGVP